jgi:hypothetical protein
MTPDGIEEAMENLHEEIEKEMEKVKERKCKVNMILHIRHGE